MEKKKNIQNLCINILKINNYVIKYFYFLITLFSNHYMAGKECYVENGTMLQKNTYT